ncbi:MAG TPA: dTDP-glucose 4,6-dehydratase [Oligoflexia bacterium]|nr:dTDP-glucose 4,6-dehydratase [Oligoflexia bacterium]HMP49158.1 dTDP-glucose 4,6-dehydratase [Oligoflexia bacterium]
MNILVTGGAGFIGSNFVRWILNNPLSSDHVSKIVVLDLLTYAGNLENLKEVYGNSKFSFKKGDIRDEQLVKSILTDEQISSVVHFAAESHVDRSIADPMAFVRTNVEGTQVLLNVAREHGIEKFVHISTDEVYGSLGPEGRFTETTPLDPSSAYSASKAASDMLALAAFKTYQFPVCVTRCTNNYGPYQFPEKLIPLFVTNALGDIPLPLYGDGKNVRSWLHVDDHSRAIFLVLTKGRVGEVYNIGGSAESEKPNVEVTDFILNYLDKSPSLIRYVEDRKGHDRRYAVDYSKIKSELGWEPSISFKDGLENTIIWYQEHTGWWKRVKSGEYQRFYELNYGTRS